MDNQETDMKGYRNGTKVRFKVGGGSAWGTVKGRDGDKYKIQTANGKLINRTAASLFTEAAPAATDPATATGEPS